MRLALRASGPLEWLALRAGVVPVAAAEAWGGMALSGVIIAAVDSGWPRGWPAGLPRPPSWLPT